MLRTYKSRNPDSVYCNYAIAHLQIAIILAKFRYHAHLFEFKHMMVISLKVVYRLWMIEPIWPEALRYLTRWAGWSSATPGASAADYVLKPDARRFEYGNAGHLGAYLLRESLAYLEGFGIEAIAAHNRALAGRLIAGLSDLGVEVMTPADAENHAGNVCFRCRDPEAVMRRAAEEGILIWADNGRVRLSAHLFTTQADIETFLSRLPALLGE